MTISTCSPAGEENGPISARERTDHGTNSRLFRFGRWECLDTSLHLCGVHWNVLPSAPFPFHWLRRSQSSSGSATLPVRSPRCSPLCCRFLEEIHTFLVDELAASVP